jgi:hypothetical protein
MALQKLIKATLFSPVTSVGSACSNLHARQAFSNTDIIMLIVLLVLLVLQKTRPLLGPWHWIQLLEVFTLLELVSHQEIRFLW